MNKITGAMLDEKSHILQSIADILTTPIGSRVMRRDYGSALFELIDQPNAKTTELQLLSVIVMALAQFEPRINLITVNLTRRQNNLTAELQFALKNMPDQQEFTTVTI